MPLSSPLFDCFGTQRKGRRKMPCTNCMAEYTRRRKEVGCAVCRFGFCERCVGQKCAVPSVSPTKPVPVCNNCYKLLTDPKQQCAQSIRLGSEKSRDFPPIGASSFPQNAWGAADRLPPPSLRSLYNNNNMTKKGNNDAGVTEWGDLEARLARLNDPNGFGEPSVSTALAQNDDNGTHMKGKVAVRMPRALPIEELEERLAALRGVPVEVVRKPRLMVINDSDDEDNHNNGGTVDMPLSEEAAQLLRQVELGYAQNSSSNNNSSGSKSLGIGANAKKQTAMADDQSSLNSECPSSVLQNVISEALREPSPSNLSDRTVSDGGQLYPNFAECVRKTIEDAQVAEREAMKFIRKYEHQQQNEGGGRQQQSADQRGDDHGHQQQQQPIKTDRRGGRRDN